MKLTTVFSLSALVAYAAGAPAGGCGTNITTGSFVSPMLTTITPNVSSPAPTGPNRGAVQPSTTLFSFTLPSSRRSRCTLTFVTPSLDTDPNLFLQLKGDGVVHFASLAAPPTRNTTWASAPSVSDDYGKQTITPGKGVRVADFACPAPGSKLGVEMDNAGTTTLDWTQSTDGAHT